MAQTTYPKCPYPKTSSSSNSCWNFYPRFWSSL